MSTIYVVMGTCGEYSDRTEWPVAAYTDEGLAKDHVKAATAKARELLALRDASLLPPEQRVLKLQDFVRFAVELQEAGRRLRR